MRLTVASRSTGQRCSATRKDGTPCQGQPVTDSTLCLSHSPAHAELLAASRVKGGKLQTARKKLARARSEALAKVGPEGLTPSLESIATLSGYLADVIGRVDNKSLSPAQGTTLVNALRLAKDLLGLALEVRLIEQAEEHGITSTSSSTKSHNRRKN
jgi:hypothetical protein